MQQNNTYHVKLGDDGRVVIPAPCRRSHNWQAGDTIVVSDTEAGLQFRSLAEVIKEVQDYFAPCRIPGQSVVDELIADRRAEAAKEAAEDAAGRAEHPRE